MNLQCVHKRMVQFQKLTRNLFLTLHGQNVHRQQRQLSQFRMRYQQFAFHAYCGAAGSVSKMAPQQEKAFCVLRFEVSRSVITVQREFRARFRKDAPHRNNITRWYRQFVETGCLCKGKSSGRPRVSNDNVERVRETGCYPNWTPIMTITFCNWTVLPPIFTGMYECFSIVFFNSAGSDVLQKETTTFSLGHPVRRI